MKFRILEAEEHDKIAGLGPFEGLPNGPNPEGSRIVVAEEDEKIVGFWCAFDAVHLEPLWIDPKVRGNGLVGKGLWNLLLAFLQDREVANAFAMIAHEDVITHLPMAARLGFKPLPTTVLFVDLTKAKEV
ncbi:MAG: GNAT family N-acetyltransferase [Planctomycetota bacterium]|jgi:hypothetical protein